jgi:hypothetical protein
LQSDTLHERLITARHEKLIIAHHEKLTTAHHGNHTGKIGGLSEGITEIPE